MRNFSGHVAIALLAAPRLVGVNISLQAPHLPYTSLTFPRMDFRIVDHFSMTPQRLCPSSLSSTPVPSSGVSQSHPPFVQPRTISCFYPL
jgi:hypothetical protein